MERTVPRSISDEIDLYLRTIYSLLRSSAEVQVRTLEQAHIAMVSSLHPLAGSTEVDAAAFLYAVQRLPPVITKCKTVVLGQSTDIFYASGYTDIESWQETSARARRRRCLYNGAGTLACYIASRSDIDDLIPILVAYQIEANKIGSRLARVTDAQLSLAESQRGAFLELANLLGIPEDDFDRFARVWDGRLAENLAHFRDHRASYAFRLLGGSLAEYWRATSAWWRNIREAIPDVESRPLYFISSNTHSVVNLLSSYARQNRDRLLDYLEQNRENNPMLVEEWLGIREKQVQSSEDNFLYYLLKKYESDPNHPDAIPTGGAGGINEIPSRHTFDVDAQVVELSKLDPAGFDPRLSSMDYSFLNDSDALILNIDYPLGFAAYNLLAKIAEHANPILGVYFMGKAATLNGRLGDVMIPSVVQDEHSQNTYLFQNAFTAADVTPYLIYGSVLDNQKAVSVLGTFLQNARYMDVFYHESFSDIEMESGPYLSAVYEMTRPKRHPVNEIVNLYGANFDIGILHYASDTPLSKGRNLGSGTLSYFGMDPTYACSIAILQRILRVEQKRLGK